MSDYSKSEISIAKPRLNLQHHQQPDNIRKSTADTTLHSIQPEALSARGLCGITTNTSAAAFSAETVKTPNFAQSQSFVFPGSSSAAQINHHPGGSSGGKTASVQRFAVVCSNDCYNDYINNNIYPTSYLRPPVEP